MCAHLQPGRGWKVIRDGGRLSGHEMTHLAECEKCSEWLASFSEMARNAGFTPRFETPFFVVADRHMSAARAWELIRDHGALTSAELGHLYTCATCNTWLAKFVDTAKAAGFPIAFEIPPSDSLQAA